MESSKYRVFVCNQCEPNNPEGCCYGCGAMEIYQAFEKEIKQRHLEDIVEIRRSGCLDRCEAGVVVLVSQPKPYEASWFPTKIQKRIVSNKQWYGHLQVEDIPELIESHFVKGQPLKRCQLSK